MISFKANYINTTQIKKLGSDNKYKTKDVSFVELDPKNWNDVFTINNIVLNWEENSFANNIAYDVNQANNGHPKKNSFRVFALTEQFDNFEKLDSNKVLALAEVEQESDLVVLLEYLQVDPKIVYAIRKTSAKRCGSAVLDCLKTIFNDKTITLNSRAEKFYIKNGFMKVGQLQYIWNKLLK